MTTRSRFARLLPGAAAIAAVLTVAACSGDSGFPTPPVASADTFWNVTATPRAITLAVGQTQQLTPIPLGINDQPIQVSGATTTYSSSDPTTVKVDANGLVTALGTTSAAKTVTIRTSANGVTRSITVFVTVVATSSTLGSVSAQIVAPDSAILGAASGSKTLRPVARNTAGTAITGVTFLFTSLDTTKATVNPNTGAVTGVAPGTVKIGVVTTAFGTTKGDTVTLTITRPTIATIALTRETVPDNPIPNIVLARNATVTWTNSTGSTIDVTFDNTAGIVPGNGTGNITNFVSGGAAQTRKFTQPGTYNWKNTLGTQKGTIVIE